MDKINKIKELLQDLEQEEIEQIKAYITENFLEDKEEDDNEENSSLNSNDETVKENPSIEDGENVLPAEENMDEAKEEEIAQSSENINQTNEQNSEEDFKAEDNKLKDDEYREIISSLNAKIDAQQEELRALKEKIEGAFGYSMKPSEGVKVNKLYDDCDGLVFHR